MRGKEILEKYMKMRDYSGSENDQYAQSLQALSIIPGFFELLEQAEKEGKRIYVRELTSGQMPFDNPTLYDLVLV